MDIYFWLAILSTSVKFGNELWGVNIVRLSNDNIVTVTYNYVCMTKVSVLR